MEQLKRISLILFLFVIYIITQSAITIETRKNFSGTWIINNAKSNFGKLTPEEGSARELKITFTKDSILIDRYFASIGLSPEHFAIEGSTFAVDVSRGDKKIIKTVTLEWIGKAQFQVSSVFHVNDNAGEWQYSRKETYTMSKNEKILTLDRETLIPDRADVVKAVYEKEVK